MAGFFLLYSMVSLASAVMTVRLLLMMFAWL